ncbi:signal transduction histidine kinase [Bogoriella caseilytica]|uniref:histidine kinase n=2 Tax=Bogoriella caseilytica TaxID=56055 RepID=A0A3N2BAQ3_9MICO|nr:signal transduction histidine kinase [Bogoriella caseilytica]
MEDGGRALCCNRHMNRELRAHLHSTGYVVFAALTLLAGWYERAGFLPWESWGLEPAPWWHGLTLAAMAGALAAKVRWPTLALLCGAGVVLADLSFGLSIGVVLCLTDLIYNQVLRASPAQVRRVRVGSLTVTAALVALTAVVDAGLSPLNALLLCVGVLFVPLWWASEVRQGYPAMQDRALKERLAAEREPALVAEYERRRQGSIEAERRRMARELHDVVSAQVASIALTSGGVLHAEPESARDRKALETIRATSVEALEELRQMVRVLRGEEDGGAGELLTEVTWEQVLARGRASGLSIDVDGAPPALPPAPRAVLLRVLQESLANAAKHGDGAARVELSSGRGALTLRVASPLPADGTEGGLAATLSGGTGLAAMQERVQLVGGRLRTEEEAGRWLVEAVLPMKPGQP